MTTATPEMTLSELEQALGARQRSLDTLLRKRDRLVKDLEATDAKIEEIGGTSARNLNPRPRNAKSLFAVVTELLTKRKSGYTLHDLAEQVLSSGYKTASSNFKNVLYQCLYNSDAFHYDEKSGTHKLKTPPAEPKTKKATAKKATAKKATAKSRTKKATRKSKAKK